MDHAEAAPGLKWRPRADGTKVPYWVAKPAYVAAGYPIRTANLAGLAPEEIAGRCAALESEALSALSRAPRSTARFNGTLGSLLAIYQTHEESPYRTLSHSSSRVYATYLRRLINEHGDTRLDNLTGLDIKRWHKAWRGSDDKLGAAAMMRAVLQAAVVFGKVSGFAHCERLRGVMLDLDLPKPQPRDQAPEAADIERARAAAHKLGRHRAALCYALQFDTTARLWDLIGQWVPLSDPRPSAIHDAGKKWIGATWADIDANMVLSLTPSKTRHTTKASIHVNLTRCQMVMEELSRIPEAERVGPLIVNEGTGLPYLDQTFQWVWRQVRAEAELPAGLWCRDIRAGGITEAQKAGAAVEDRAKLAGHSSKVNSGVYARDRLAASDRVVEARERFRKGSK